MSGENPESPWVEWWPAIRFGAVLIVLVFVMAVGLKHRGESRETAMPDAGTAPETAAVKAGPNEAGDAR